MFVLYIMTRLYPIIIALVISNIMSSFAISIAAEISNVRAYFRILVVFVISKVKKELPITIALIISKCQSIFSCYCDRVYAVLSNTDHILIYLIIHT